MLKSFMYFLLFLFVFVLGMQIGTNTPDNKQNDPRVEAEPTYYADARGTANEYQTIIEVEQNSEYDIEERNEHFTSKFARILENVVSGFYDIIVNILYRTVEVLF